MRSQEIEMRSTNFAEEINRQLDEEFGLEITDVKSFSNSIIKSYHKGEKIEAYIFKNTGSEFEITEINSTLIICINFKNEPIKDEAEIIKEEILKMKSEISQVMHNHEAKTNEKYFIFFVNCHFGNGKLIESYKSKKSTSIINGEISWIKDFSQLLNETINDKKTKIPQNKIKLGFTYAEYIKKGEDFDISISSRIKSAQASNLSEFDVSGRVFTASLYSISKLYGHIGDELYKHNLRKRLGNKINGVDENIEKTLKEKPDHFWYFNNGITMLVDSKHINYDDPENIRITNIGSDYSDSLLSPISIINGAQTISVANEYYSKINLDVEERLQLRKSRDYAEVILRVVSYDSSISNTENVSEWIDEISVSLNRQKPIKSEDIVYNHRLINAVNKIKDEKFGFEILKRGYHTSDSSRKYNLISVMKLFRSYLDSQPGAAKTGSGSLIDINDIRMEVEITLDESKLISKEEVDTENDKVKVNILFADNFTAKKRQDLFKKRVFDENYKPVNYLMKLYSKLKKIKRKSEWNLDEFVQTTSLPEKNKKNFDSKVVEAVRKYGEYHIIDAITHYELEVNKINLSDWTKGSRDADHDFSDDSIKKIILAYSFAWKDYLIKLSEKHKENAEKSQSKKSLVDLDFGINPFKQNLDFEEHNEIISKFNEYMNKI